MQGQRITYREKYHHVGRFFAEIKCRLFKLHLHIIKKIKEGLFKAILGGGSLLLQEI